MNSKKLRDELIGVLKSQQWEKCKGELRAFIALDGAHYCNYEGNKVMPGDWEEIQRRTDEFIKSIEDDGLHE